MSLKFDPSPLAAPGFARVPQGMGRSPRIGSNLRGSRRAMSIAETSGCRALKTREDAKKRKFLAAHGGRRGNETANCQTEITTEPLGAQGDLTEMHRHAFWGAWSKGPPGALALRSSGGRWGLLESRRWPLKPCASPVFQGHPHPRGEGPQAFL